MNTVIMLAVAATILAVWFALVLGAAIQDQRRQEQARRDALARIIEDVRTRE